eukprot:m.68207 g.68207  ORF g.68207 m.68207 type:complete len:494 (-) comp18293_c0_seq1:52-1533(-)
MGEETVVQPGIQNGMEPITGHRHPWRGLGTPPPPANVEGDTRFVLLGLFVTLVSLAVLRRTSHSKSRPRSPPVHSSSTLATASTNNDLGPNVPSPSTTKHETDQEKLFTKFAWLYLPPYFLGVFADWMLGPYVYAIYTAYGYSMSEIGTLYVVGFIASLSLGTLMGPFSDRYGRKTSALIFCGVYVVSCLCKNVGSFSMLVAGRIFGGVGTSLLYTAFESWAVYSLDESGLEEDQKSRLFALATFGNAMSAVLAGLITYPLNEEYGPVAPFNAAIIPLILCAGCIMYGWEENYGSRRRTMGSSLFSGVGTIFKDRRIFTVGLVSAFFEAVLYIFVFIWTPSLQLRANGEDVPLGLVFACYMLAKMCGTYAFEHLLAVTGVESSLTWVLAISAVSFAWPVWRRGYLDTLMAHCAFEFSVGMYWPAVSTLRSACITEELRSTTMSLFRVPLNLFVVFSLSGIEDLTDVQVYRSCSTAMIFVALSHYFLVTSATDL